MMRGSIVKTWFDTGALGHQILFGVVTEAGPVSFTVTWESGRKNRIRYDNTKGVTLHYDADGTARELLVKRGVIPGNFLP